MNLTVTIIQSELHWENVDKNLAMFTDKISSIKEDTDLIVLPEMFTTGFTMNSERLAETMYGKTVTWMKQQAKTKNAVVVGSLIIEENQAYFNRLIWAQPNGTIFHYNKRHLFRMANEHERYSLGTERLIVDLKGWKICPLICYDLRFPVWSRNKKLKVESSELKVDHSPHTTHHSPSAFDCLIYVANWPEARKTPWSKLLEARAIENQVYVVGVNRVGADGKDIPYSGNSAVIDPKGNKISTVQEHQNTIETITLNRQELEDFRIKFPVGLDGDDFEIMN